MISLKIEGLKEVTSKFGRMPIQLGKALNDAIKISADALESGAKMALTVGETRALKTGYLRGSTGVQELAPFRATVASLAPYAIYVHEGTQKMRARPYLKKAVDQNKSKIESIFEKEIARAIK